MSGGLLIWSQHIQAKRDDRRQQRNIERAVRYESLDQVRHAIDSGARIITVLEQLSREDVPNESSAIALIDHWNDTVSGALISVTSMGAQQLRDELVANTTLIERVKSRIDAGTFERTLLGEVIDSLARIESLYIELKVRF